MLKRKVAEVLEQNEHNEMLLDMHANNRSFLYANCLAEPTEKHILNATEFIQSQIGFDLTEAQVRGILMLYPQASIKLAVYDGLEDTEVRDLISSAVAHFFLGCDWPTYGDKVDITVFCKALRAQAVKMKFTH